MCIRAGPKGRRLVATDGVGDGEQLRVCDFASIQKTRNSVFAQKKNVLLGGSGRQSGVLDVSRR